MSLPEARAVAGLVAKYTQLSAWTLPSLGSRCVQLPERSVVLIETPAFLVRCL